MSICRGPLASWLIICMLSVTCIALFILMTLAGRCQSPFALTDGGTEAQRG